jgi:hypothetical protein
LESDQVSDELSGLTEKLTGFVGKWTAYAAFGTFLLYLFGYLSLRFELSTYGLATDLDLFDEKYMFAGSRFLVYMVSAVPNVLLIVIVLIALLSIPWKLLPSPFRTGTESRCKAWAASPGRLSFLGVILSLCLIQFVMRKCFVLGNLLLAKNLPDQEWIAAVLRWSDGSLSLYFSGLVAGLLLTTALLLLAMRSESVVSSHSRLLTDLLIFLVAVQFMLLPVNYGVLVSSQELPRVSDLAGGEVLPKGGQAWLVWESKDTLTYLVREDGDNRTLVTVPRKDARIKIVSYDAIFHVLFSGNQPVIPGAPQENHHD